MKNLICILCLIIGTSTIVFSQSIEDNYWTDRIYFQTKISSNIELPSYNENSRSEDYSDIPELQNIVDRYDIQSLEIAFEGMHSLKLQHTYRVVFEEAVVNPEMVQDLANSSELAFAEMAPKNYPQIVPNDIAYSQLWFMDLIKAPDAWDIIDPKQKVVLAVVDDAILFNHEDLEDNLWINTSESNGSPGVDDDGNGFIDDIIGWDGAENDNNPSPPSNANEQYFMHGTHVAGTAGAVTDNTRGIAAISYNNIELMACKGSRDSDAAFTGILEAFAYAISNNAPVINNSWGRSIQPDGSPPVPLSNTELFLLEEAKDRNLICVFAAGNDNSPYGLPAEHESVIAVAATGNAVSGILDEKASYSNYGEWVDIAAPGTQILSCVPGQGKYTQLQGTSMAAPNVASLIALMKSHAPQLTKNQIVSCLLNSTDDIVGVNPDHNGLLGAGRINVLKAIQCVSGQVELCNPSMSLSVTEVTETAAKLNWSTVGEADAYEVQIKNSAATNWYSFENNPFTGNELSVTGLEICQSYDFRVKSVCGSSESEFADLFTFETVCDSGGTDDECLEWQAVYASLIDGGNCQNSPSAGEFEVWANESYLVESCPPGQVYNFSICDGYSSSNWEALITVAKVNADATLGEVIKSSNNCEIEFQISSSESDPIDILIIVADADDCGGDQNQVNNGIPVLSCLNQCSFPTDLSVGDIMPNQVKLRWDLNADADSYTVQARRVLDTDWVEAIGLQNDNIEYTNLAPCTEYEFRVKSICGSSSSAFSPSFTFKTTGCNNACAAVGSLSITNVNENSAIINWPDVSTAISYELSYKHEQSNNWLVQEASNSILTLDNLTACLSYQVRVVAICDSGESLASDVYDFETDCPNCAAPNNVQILAITDNKAHIVWDQSSTHLSYVLRAKALSDTQWSEGEISNSTAIYSGLSACTDYEIQLMAVCADEESGFSNSYIFTTRACTDEPDCTSYGINAQDEWIDRVKFGSINHSSGQDFGYAFIDQYSNEKFNAGQSYNIELTPGFKDAEYNEYWRVWIDANRDGDFGDSGEMIFETSNPSAQVVSSTIQIPANAISGPSFIRVAMKYVDGNNDNTPPTPCGSFSFGEVEDYLIHLDGSVATADENELSIKVFPNPVTSLLYFEGLKPNDQVMIYNQMGQLILTETNANMSNTLDVSDFSRGVFSIQMLNSNGELRAIQNVVKL